MQRGGRNIDARWPKRLSVKVPGNCASNSSAMSPANLVAVAADARAQRGDNTLRPGSLGHHLFDGGADHTVLQATTAAMRGADHASFRIGHEHRQAVGGEHAERHVLLSGHLAVRFNHCRLIRGFGHLLSGFALAAQTRRNRTDGS